MDDKDKEDIEFTRFDDGSILKISRVWLDCFEQKMKDINQTMEEGRAEFLHGIDEYWRKRQVLTKYGVEPWGEEYKTKADLAHKVMYAYIRAYLFAWAFKMLAEHDSAKPIKVIALTDEGLREIKLDSRDGAGE